MKWTDSRKQKPPEGVQVWCAEYSDGQWVPFVGQRSHYGRKKEVWENSDGEEIGTSSIVFWSPIELPTHNPMLRADEKAQSGLTRRKKD